jgi:hypothetical protein
MQGSDESSTSFRNAFTRLFLDRIGELDEPPSAGEADVAGPWVVEVIPGFGFGLFRRGEGWSRGFLPSAVFARRPWALLAAAVLPGTGRDAAFILQKNAGPAGYGIESGGELAGHVPLFDEKLVDALHVAEMLVRNPESLSNLLEAAGALALERTGAILDERFPAE